MFRHILLFWLKRKTKTHWNSQSISDEVQNLYNQHKTEIEKVYSKVTHWHGTGRYHYKINGDSKYDSNVDYSKIIDIFDQILEAKKLSPQMDNWTMSDKEYKKSVSTTAWKMYAHFYLEIHSTPGTLPKNIFGYKGDIVLFIILYSLILMGIPFAANKLCKGANFNTKHQSIISTWFAIINNTFESKNNDLKDFLEVAINYGSSIKGNYGILLGINADPLKEAKVSPVVKLFESRFANSISLDNVTHIEVTYIKVEEVKALLKLKDINIPVLPLEACELYYSKLDSRFWFNKDGKIPEINIRKLWELWEYYNRGYR